MKFSYLTLASALIGGMRLPVVSGICLLYVSAALIMSGIRSIAKAHKMQQSYC